MTYRKHPWLEIERIVLNREQPLDLKAIAKEFHVPYGQVKNRASKHHWAERHRFFLRNLQKEQQKWRLKKAMSDYKRFDEGVVKISEAILHQIQHHLKNAQQKDEPMKVNELRCLADAVAKVSDIERSRRGDTATALRQLIEQEVLPPSVAMAIIDIIDEEDEKMQAKFSEIFRSARDRDSA